MVYDRVRDRVVLYGGVNPNVNSVPLGDTWEYDGTDWTQVATSGVVPLARANHSLVYDGNRQRIVLFGGCSTLTASFHQCSGSVLADTWEFYDNVWHRMAPQTVPQPRYHHMLGYDALNQKVVLFGGMQQNPGPILGDTWVWDGTNWSQGDVDHYAISGQVTDGSQRPVAGVRSGRFAQRQHRCRRALHHHRSDRRHLHPHARAERLQLLTGHAHGQPAAGCGGTGFQRLGKAVAGGASTARALLMTVRLGT